MQNSNCCGAYEDGMSLPEYRMTAGESKVFTIPIYNNYRKQIDATGMTARLAISSHVNPGMAPFVVKQCSVAKWDAGLAVLTAELLPADTIDLQGKFVYQVTAKDVMGDFGIMRGFLYIYPNNDRAAISQ